jgi:integrase
VTDEPQRALTPRIDMATAGQVANTIAQDYTFADHQERVSKTTRSNHAADLNVFTRYLQASGIADVGDLLHDPHAWRHITYGLISGFVRWQMQDGYAVGSVNRRLATVKQFVTLAFQADVLSKDEYLRIQKVRGYRLSEGRNADETRPLTRKAKGKKGQPVVITPAQAAQLKQQPATPQGLRDALLMCLLLDHGLRIGEVALLRIEHFHLSEGTFTFYRPKVHKEQTHRMERATLMALSAYLMQLGRLAGPLWYASTKHGALQEQVMSVRALQKRVAYLGAKIGVSNLSPHDCRHYWTTYAIRSGTDIKTVQEAGGWNSPAMVLRYAESNAIANEGVRLPKGA